VEDLVQTARSGIAGQVELMVRYIEKAGLASALRSKDWTTFARGYNGPGYAKQGYHTKLAQAYWRAKVTQNSERPNQISGAERDMLRRGDRGERVQELQRQLTALGYVVDADGVFGGSTEAALKQFQNANSIAADGISGLQTDRLMADQLPQFSLWKWFKHLIKRAFRRAT
jgi:murein L,D-transpeptidase YcbB/YkuD